MTAKRIRSAPWFLALFFCLSDIAWSQGSDLGEIAEQRLDPIIRDVRRAALEGDVSSLRFRIASSNLVFAAAVWNSEDELLFPNASAFVHVSDELILNEESRWRALLVLAAPTAWERRDVTGELLHYCRKDKEPICLVVNAAALATELNLTTAELWAAFNRKTGWSWTWPAAVAGVLLLALVGWRAWLMRSRTEKPRTSDETFALGDVVIAPRKLAGTRGDLTFDLTQRDIKLLAHLAAHPGDVVTKDELYTIGWGRDFMPNSRALEQHMMTLRRKLDPDKTRANIIETVHGQGYRFAGRGS